tara:strand:+ start:117 stop:662 length:546 start_codon:yes stop_codon:yes gene_type:complete
MNFIKRSNDDLKANRPTLEEVKFIPKVPISILVEDVRSVYNVGSIFRTADSFGAHKIFLTGITACPPREDLHKTALGSENSVDWEYHKDSIALAKKIKKEGINLTLIEQTKKSKNIFDVNIEFPVCFIVGNEVEGVSEDLAKLVDTHLEIPMNGIKQSLNVSVATGIVGYELCRKYRILKH